MVYQRPFPTLHGKKDVVPRTRPDAVRRMSNQGPGVRGSWSEISFKARLHKVRQMEESPMWTVYSYSGTMLLPAQPSREVTGRMTVRQVLYDPVVFGR